LNEQTVSASRTAAGILFHTTGPATEKALSPNFVLVRGTEQLMLVAQRRRIRAGSLLHACTSTVTVQPNDNCRLAVTIAKRSVFTAMTMTLCDYDNKLSNIPVHQHKYSTSTSLAFCSQAHKNTQYTYRVKL